MRDARSALCLMAFTMLLLTACSAGGPRQENAKVSTVGWGRVRIGASQSEVEAVLGSSVAQQDFPAMNGEPAVVFHDYLDKGVQVSYTKPDMTVNALFFYSGEGEHSKYTQFAGEADRGITWTSSPEDVLAAYGAPLNDYKSDDGGRGWRRLAYSDISFRFQDGRLETIGVGLEETKAAPAASDETPAQRDARLARQAKRAAAAAAEAKKQAALAVIRGTDQYKVLTAENGMSDAQARSFIKAASIARMSDVDKVASRKRSKHPGDTFRVVADDGGYSLQYTVRFHGNGVATIRDWGGVSLYSKGKRNTKYVYWEDIGGPERVVDVTKSLITSILKAPSTAEFPGGWLDPLEGWSLSKPAGKVIAGSYVDSENSFGAMLRSKFQVEYKVSTGKRKGSLTPLRIYMDGHLVAK